MISAKECREHLAGIPLTDEQVENLQAALYALVENVLDVYIKNPDTFEPCRMHSSTAGCPQSDRRPKAMALKAKSTAVASLPARRDTK